MQYTCNHCNKPCIRKGVRNAIQKYQCKGCGKYQQSRYTYKKLDPFTRQAIVNLTKEGSGMNSISRLVKRSVSTIQRVLFKAGNEIPKPAYHEADQEYEIDEMTLTIVGKKDIYLIYAINRTTRKVTDFVIGNRTKENISKVVDAVLFYSPRRIFTDGLNSYPSLIPKAIHRPGRHLTNRIERKNLTFRNLVKRLSRCTLCISKKSEMLRAVMSLVCWN